MPPADHHRRYPLGWGIKCSRTSPHRIHFKIRWRPFRGGRRGETVKRPPPGKTATVLTRGSLGGSLGRKFVFQSRATISAPGRIRVRERRALGGQGQGRHGRCIDARCGPAPGTAKTGSDSLGFVLSPGCSPAPLWDCWWPKDRLRSEGPVIGRGRS